jgi:general secretion pathway protein I
MTAPRCHPERSEGSPGFINGLTAWIMKLIKQNGFTLLEVMVSLSIIAIVLVSVLVSQTQSLSLQDETKFNTTAAMLAQQKISEIEIKKTNELTSDSGDFGVDFPNYYWEIVVQDVSLAGAEKFTKNLKQIDVNVRRGETKRYLYGLRFYRFAP